MRNSASTWKKITASGGVVEMPSVWNEAYIAVSYWSDDLQETIGCYGCFVPNDALGTFNTRLFVGGYYVDDTDYGCCWLNATKAKISFRNYIYAGQSRNSNQVDISVRYR